MTPQDTMTELQDTITELYSYGLTTGVGTPEPGKMCAQAAIAFALGEPHGDEVSCDHPADRTLKIAMNDGFGGTNKERGDLLLPVALASLGTVDKDRTEWAHHIAEQTIRRVLPMALRAIGLDSQADRCRDEGTHSSAEAAAQAAGAAAVAAARAARAAAGAFGVANAAVSAAQAARVADRATAYATAYATASATGSASACASAPAADPRAGFNVWQEFQKIVLEAYAL